MRSSTPKASRAIVVSGMILLIGTLGACSKMQSSEGLVAEAKEYRQKGDNKAAVIQLKNALQKNADDAEARYILGNVYNEAGDPLSAEKELRRALALGIAPERVLPSLATALLVLGQHQKVLDETSQLVTAKGDAELFTLRGNAYLALGKLTEAKQSFDSALKEKTDFPDALVGLAKHALAQKDVGAATTLAERAVTANPNSPNAWQFKGDLVRAQGKIEPALAAYEQVLKLKPGDAGAHLVKASLEIQSSNFDAAKGNIDAARKTAPNALNVAYTQALYEFTQKKHAAAWESLQQVLRVAPEHMPSLLLAGAVQLSLGSNQQAEQHLKKYLEKNPGHPYASQMLAAALLKNGHPERAIDTLNAALKNAPENPQLLALAGEAHMKTKDFAKATKYFEKATALAPQAAPIRTALAMSNLARGENSRAIADLEQATGLDGKSPQAGVLLVMTHMRLKDFDKALMAVQALEKEQPDNPMVHSLKGGVYLGKKDVGNARASFEKSLALQSTYYPAALNLAKLDLAEKKPDAAKKRFEAILEKDKKNLRAMAALSDLAQSRGQKQEATEWLERAAKENPDDAEAAILLASHYLRSGEKQKSLTLARQQHATQPANSQLLDLLAQAQLANNDLRGALESYNKLAAAMPTSAVPQLRIAAVYAVMKDYTAALDATKKALSLQPDFLDAQLMQASLEIRAGRHDQALTIARQIQKQRSKAPAGYILEGDVLMAQDKPELAVKAYEQGFGVNKNGTVLMKVHESLRKAGREKEADARINQWLKEHPDDMTTRMHFGTASLVRRDGKTAIKQFQAVLQKDPKNAVALNNLAVALQQEKDPSALEYAEKAQALAPESPSFLDTLGWILVEQGNTTRGLPLLQKAASLAPQSSEIRYHFAMGLAKSGDRVKARQELEQLLASEKQFSNIDEAKAALKELQ